MPVSDWGPRIGQHCGRSYIQLLAIPALSLQTIAQPHLPRIVWRYSIIRVRPLLGDRLCYLQGEAAVASDCTYVATCRGLENLPVYALAAISVAQV